MRSCRCTRTSKRRQQRSPSMDVVQQLIWLPRRCRQHAHTCRWTGRVWSLGAASQTCSPRACTAPATSSACCTIPDCTSLSSPRPPAHKESTLAVEHRSWLDHTPTAAQRVPGHAAQCHTQAHPAQQHPCCRRIGRAGNLASCHHGGLLQPNLLLENVHGDGARRRVLKHERRRQRPSASERSFDAAPSPRAIDARLHQRRLGRDHRHGCAVSCARPQHRALHVLTTLRRLRCARECASVLYIAIVPARVTRMMLERACIV